MASQLDNEAQYLLKTNPIASLDERVQTLLQSYLLRHPSFTKLLLRESDREREEPKNNVGLANASDIRTTIYRSVQEIVRDNIMSRIDMDPVTIGLERRNIERSLRSQTDAEALYQSYRRTWRASQTYLQLKAHLDKITFPSINKIVCFALGAPSNFDQRESRRSNIQHAAVESLIEILNEKAGGNKVITCYAQEPLYNHSDRELLRTIGIETIDDPEGPEGFLKVDENTLVVSISPNVPVRQIIADLVWPGAMLWDTVKSMDNKREEWIIDSLSSGSTDPESPRLQMLVKNCNQENQHRLQDDDIQVFGDVTLYIRK